MFLLNRFFAANRRLSAVVEGWLPASFKRHLHTVYKYEVAALMNSRPGQTVLDIGGGKDCPFLPFVTEPAAHRVIAIDCSEEELRGNTQLQQKVVADVAAAPLPLRDGSADLVVSRSVVEHLQDNAAFFGNCARMLRPGGVVVHTFPCKFAPFALLNKLLPNRVSRRLLAWFQPAWVDTCGFLAYYDRCYYSAIRRLLADNDFCDAQYTFRYYQSIYFDFFFPLYLLTLAYDLTIWFFGIRNLACAILVRARRPAVSPERADPLQADVDTPSHAPAL
ncbi:MAG TPA: class I SAM-dependent methyltransferase [Stellaceae bacterium]|jgi:ubiquinone/menaquinone biosynthesis C-methylase UbiE